MNHAANTSNSTLVTNMPVLVRIDFAPPGSTCCMCAKELSVARVVQDAAGNEDFYGPDCVQRVIPANDLATQKKVAPNLTLRNGAAGGGNRTTVGNNTSGGKKTADDRRKQAVEYLLLRAVKIPLIAPQHQSKLQWPGVMQHYAKLQAGTLSDADVDSLLRIAQNAPPQYRRTNLLDVYAAACQLDRKLAKATDKDYLLETKGILLSKMKLLPSRIKTAKLDLQKTAFAW